MSNEDEHPDDNPAARAQAHALRDQARAGGLRFEAYLPHSLADWLLEEIERGRFADPSEAMFVMAGLFRDLEPHRDLREELLRRTLQASMDDPLTPVPAADVFVALRRELSKPRAQPAHWHR